MSNTATLVLEITNVEGDVPGEKLSVAFRKMVGARRLPRSKFKILNTHKPPLYAFQVPAIPEGFALAAEISSQSYRTRYSQQFSLKGDEERTVDAAPLFRKAAEWTPNFTRWSRLGERFRPLKDVLAESDTLQVRGWKKFDSLIGTTYDNITHPTGVLAKTSLLNLFTKLEDTIEPTKKRKSWFSFIQKILEISRERLIAQVDDEMGARVFQIHQNINQFASEYRRAPVGDHKTNLPSAYRLDEIKSLKTDESKANLQLTVARGVHTQTGEAVTLLDADIDESGDLIPHIIDAFLIHPFSGGTHPHDIHEFLVAQGADIDLGYTLVPQE